MSQVNQFAVDCCDSCTLVSAQNKAMLVLLMVAVTSLVHSAPVINISLPLDCEDVYNLKISTNKSASVPSGVYTIYPAGPDEPVTVYCDMGCGENNSHQDGKWTVIQRRIDGNVSFYQPWEQYKNGFGDANGEYWIGLRNIFLMTYREKYQLKVNIEDFEDGNAYAQYTFFYIDPESNNYRLNIGGYIDGGAGDSLSYVNGREFSTFDKDPTGYCADTFSGGFWYSYYYWGQCHLANPNGLYKHGNMATANTGIMWQTWKGNYYSLKNIVMKIRRLGLEDITNL
ncbi:microfibril-associated glycoprotein 4-like isoform X1 [Silurus meridionalis]|uniref:microfibril-associated glycoprotein 4-like isoform X1 n=1 Tax=Silurus meridionalis TaxID=175797 RepID=UPI001EEA0B26|nr:microfibril-associated glycoprotein 4-like isoform X1 [Silurus meridionalis]